MRNWMFRPVVIFGVLGLSLVLAIGCASAPTATDPQEFYKGKTFTLVSSSKAGGLSDLLLRAIAPYLGKETGGVAKVEMIASDAADNYVFEEAPRDGLIIAYDNTNAMLSNDLLKSPGVRYETEKFNFLADVNPTSQLLQVSPKVSYRTVEALRQAKGLKAGASSARGSMAVGGAVMMEILGLDGTVVTGYDGQKAVLMAVGRGEADFLVGTDGGAQQNEADGLLINLFAVTNERSPALPDLPTMFELGVKVPKELEGPLTYIGANGTSSFVSPGVPQDRVAYLRKVFLKISEIKEFQQEIEKITGMWRAFIPGKDLQDRMVTMKADKGLASQLDTIFAKYKAVK
ncbi:MAG: hypothetical protein HYY30_00925 [Chloroflexi bacterium]|nr:hypothetical protein [Chloroflexota bacterium]